MLTRTHPRLFTIPVHRAFADALAAGLIREHGDDPLALARGMVLLPNNRAVTAVRDAFVRLQGGAVLLPRLVAVGEGDLDAAAGAALDRMDGDPLPPVIDPVQRRLLLAQLVRDADPDRAHSAGAALHLADGLARALDALAFEERSLADLIALVEDDAGVAAGMATHWRAALHLLTRLTVLWPEKLATLGLADRSAVRNALLDRTAQAWAAHGLPVPWMVAAGITTSAPVIARLLKAVAFADGGTVVFPHLDLIMPDDQWDMLGSDPRELEDNPDAPPPLETHAQFHLKLLLSRMGMARAEVDLWPDAGAYDGPPDRASVISTLLAPAAATTDWHDVPPAKRKLRGVTAITCANPAGEALAVALAMRETLETAGRTAALVTPDRAIALRVTAHLARWRIAVDDSAGQPLAQTTPGALLLALAEAAGAHFAPVALLRALSHPLIHAEDKRREWLDDVRRLDLALRGPRPPAGLSGIADAVASLPDRRRDPALEHWWADVTTTLAPLDQFGDLSFADALSCLLTVLTSLAGDAPWAGAAGRALADLVERLTVYAASYTEPLPMADVAAMLRALMDDIAVRPPQGGHPRLFIWGLIEARLQRADLMILAGLNEGQWPQPPAPDPWLSPGIRRRLGLPGLERQIGLSSHDFASALGASEVILTRAMRDGSAPTIPSRLKLRIDALMGKDNPKPGPIDYAALAAALDAATIDPRGERPAPAPPADIRPKKISASRVDTLLADPFSWYAKDMLGLSPLDPLEAAPEAAWRGTEVHLLLENWLKSGSTDVEELVAAAEARLARSDVTAILRALWSPRLIAALRWVGQTINANRAEARTPIIAATEKRGEIDVAGIVLSGKADRIDHMADGTLGIVDYKSGGKVSKKAVDAGFVLQLGLLGAIAEGDGFPDATGDVTTFEYWRLSKTRKGGFGWSETPFRRDGAGIQADGFTAMALDRLTEAAVWLTTDAPFTAKLRPEYALYADYDQLMRLEEWYGILDTPAELEP